MATLGKIGVRIMAGTMMLSPAMAMMEPLKLGAMPALEGRWKQVGEPDGYHLRLGALELSKCDDGLCGRLVTESGCGPRQLRLSPSPGQPKLYEGALEIDGHALRAKLYTRAGREGRLELSASEPPASAEMASRTIGLSAELVADGPPRCPN